jgi:hypothetical protein
VIARRDVRLSVAIQHHPARPDLLKRLLGDLAAELDAAGPRPFHTLEVEVVADPDPHGDPSPWRTAKLAWALTPPWCTHRLVIQDDAMPCTDFLWAAVEAIRHRPAALVSFFMGWAGTWMASAMRAQADTSSWYLHPDRSWLPHVALAMPRELAVDLAVWVPPDVRDRRADDEAVAWWSQERRTRGVGVDCWVTIPSLVQHDDDAPSTMYAHRGAQAERVATGERMRRAACWIGDYHPRVIDWTRGL